MLMAYLRVCLFAFHENVACRQRSALSRSLSLESDVCGCSATAEADCCVDFT